MRSDTCEAQFIPVKKSGSGIGGFECGGGAGDSEELCFWARFYLAVEAGCLDYRSFMDTACDGAGIARTARTTIVIQLF